MIDREIASIKRDLQNRMWRYLDANLDPETKKKLKLAGERSVQDILGHVADWVYSERATLLIEMANRITGMKRGATRDYDRQDTNEYGEQYEDGIVAELKSL